MVAKSAEVQARDFIYELNNCASEYGIGKEESWNLSVASDKQKAAFEKKYYPMVSALLSADVVTTMPALVAAKLQLVITGVAQADTKPMPKEEQQYLVAYNANRKM